MKSIFIVVLNRDFICCPLGPRFLICKVKGLDNIIKVFFSINSWAYSYIHINMYLIYILKVVYLSIPTSFSSQ